MLPTAIIASILSLQPDPAAAQPPHGQPESDQSIEGASAESSEIGGELSDDTLAALDDLTVIAPGVWRAAGPMDLQVSRDDRGDVPVFSFDSRMIIDTKLPVGYPQPTPPEVIEIKAYPGVRRAEIAGQGNPDTGMNLAFWPLFQHIDRNRIEMTAPVEMDYTTSESLGAPRLDGARPRAWTMSFLYEQDSDGPTGEFGRVEVVDREPMLVLALGVRGQYRYSRSQAAMLRLDEWLDANPQWEAVGNPRMLGYNGPDRRPADQWAEVQVPIRLVASSDPVEGDGAASAPSSNPPTNAP